LRQPFYHVFDLIFIIRDIKDVSREEADMLKNHYVSFRRETKLQAEESGQISAIPLTVRQLESLIRIAESLAKMQLSEEANEDHVKEAVRLFKVSTLKAAKEKD